MPHLKKKKKKKWAKPGLFCLFSFFSRDKYSTNLTINYKSIDGVLGTRTRGSRMVGTDESTELTPVNVAFIVLQQTYMTPHVLQANK